MKLLIAVVLSLLLWADPVQATRTIQLDGTSEEAKTREAHFVEELLEQAYERLGYQLTYTPVPLGRSTREADNGTLDGLRGRVGLLQELYPNLVRVEYPLLEFHILLIGDRRVCGVCDYSQIRTLAMPRGFTAGQRWLDENPRDSLEVIKVLSGEAALKMQASGRVDAALIASPMLPDDIRHQSHRIIVTLDTLTDYHYLHKQHQALATNLTTTLMAMEEQGLVASLREQYGIAQPGTVVDVAPGTVSVVTAAWGDYTAEADDAYWQLLKAIFESEGIQINPVLTNWRRAKAEFSQGRHDILLGAYRNELPDDVLSGELHLEYEHDVIAIAPTESLLNEAFDEGRPVSACVGMGYEFEQWLPDNVNIYRSPDIARCLRLLSNQKVGLVIDYPYNFVGEFEAYPRRVVHGGLPLFPAFHNTARGQGLKTIFERRMRELVLAGQAEQYYPDLAMPLKLYFYPISQP